MNYYVDALPLFKSLIDYFIFLNYVKSQRKKKFLSVNCYHSIVQFTFTLPLTKAVFSLGSCGGWGSWGGCSKTCGSGFKVRRRQCSMNNLHLKEQKTSCNTNLCPGEGKR